MAIPNPETRKIVIVIQPFAGISADETKFIFNNLISRYPFVELRKAEPLPASAHNSQKNRYRADSLINWLASRTTHGKITIGLTNEDISTTKGTIADWGVIGLGFQPGKAAIASSFRLSPELRNEQLFKIAIHEIGHTLGLGHCSEKTCFMRDAEGGNPTNEESGFCESCRLKLQKTGFM